MISRRDQWRGGVRFGGQEAFRGNIAMDYCRALVLSLPDAAPFDAVPHVVVTPPPP